MRLLLVALLLAGGCTSEGKGPQVRGVDKEAGARTVDGAPIAGATPDARPTVAFGTEIPDAVAAPLVPGIYRVLGNHYVHRFRTREITETEDSRFFVELEFGDGGAFRACLASKYKSHSKASKYAPNGPREGGREDDLDKGLAGSWRTDGDAFVVEVTETSDGCDGKLEPAKVAELRCTGLQVTDPAVPLLAACAVSGSWEQTFEQFVSVPVGPSGAAWIVAGLGDGVELRVNESRGLEIRIVPAKKVLSRSNL